MPSLSSLTPDELATYWRGEGRRRAWFIFDHEEQRLHASRDVDEPLALAIASDDRDFDSHDAIFLEVGAESGALMGAFLHRTVRGQGQGGLRNWRYDTVGEFLKDGMRLSKGMGRKCALAGLWWGGGKGVLCRPQGPYGEDSLKRPALYRDYGRFISSLRGAYVTAEDVGTTASDMVDLHQTTRFVTCVPPELGGSGNPSVSTARGVVCAMEAALTFLKMGEIGGKTVALQGLGHVGHAMLELLLQKGVGKVVASDIDQGLIERVRAAFPGAPVEFRVALPGDTSILEEPCDVLAPSALGGILHRGTIPKVKAPIVCGAANNQLLDDRLDDVVLAERNITFVPDFVANRMGIVQCANEQYGSLSRDPALERHFSHDFEGSVYQTTLRVLAVARERSLTPTRAANLLADELAEQPHPLWGDRARHIIRSLAADQWHDG